MINLLSKSPETYEKLAHQLVVILNEQRHQRADLATIKRQLHTIIIDLGIQKQVDTYFDETSPQTEQAEHGTTEDSN